MHGAHDDLAGVDLNLLLALAALLAERHVTRAAARLGVTQSAASHALARLRDQLADPLLVRGPRGAMVPTARAEALAPQVERALAEVAAVLRRPAAFDPASARRTFHVGAGDFAELVLLPRLAARLAATAPGVDLFVRAAAAIGEALASGEIDVAIAPARPPELRGVHYQRHLFDEHFVCAVRRGHPATTRRLTLDRFCAMDHLLIAPRGTAGGFVDDALAGMGRTRRVALAVPHFLVVPHVLTATDLIVTLASRVATAYAGHHDLVTLRPPLALPGFAMHVLWHERTHADPAQRWLRDQIAAVAAEVTSPARASRAAQ